MYSCHTCKKQFCGGNRINNINLWEEYVSGRRTLGELAAFNGCSERTVRRRLALVVDEFTPCFPSNAVIIIDTTYFGRDFGVMLFLNASSGVVLHRKFVRNETNTLYHEGLDFLSSNGTHISAVVCDGRTGLLSSFAECPAQMCQFHQLQIVRRLLTSNPRLIAGRELLTLCVKMKSMGKAVFSAEFDEWCEKWRKFLSERTLLVSGKTTYTHRKLRSARKSIMSHLKWLFTYEDYPELGIPCTTNKLEGVNSLMKRLLANHNGLNERNKKKFIDAFLNGTKMQ